jgi:beta-ribofuranosylaminobenzene 5'-phosphate synthase
MASLDKSGETVAVRAFSRLHFGLLNPVGRGSAGTDAAEEALPLRCFGGVGLMIERPGLRVHARPASSWSAAGPLAERALTFAHRFAQRTRIEEGDKSLSPRHLLIDRAAAEHAGLGTGTQLGLAVARALAVSWGLHCDLPTLARRVGRGLRSALGAHGFERGGLMVESGKRANELAPLVVRLPFPESWRLVLVLPSTDDRNAGMHGAGEVEAFDRLAAHPVSHERTDALCRLVLLGLLPALVECDLDAFGAALHEFNVRVGEAFAPVQGSVYASPRIAERVAFVRGQGVRGVGQSSWGPTVFAVVADDERAQHLATRLRERFGLEDADVLVTSARNNGAVIERT